MITVAAVLQRVRGLDAAMLELFIAHDWVRPARYGGEPRFAEIDVARLTLIVELRHEMEVGDAAMPVVLSLLDQLHATRRQMRALCRALAEQRSGSVAAVLQGLEGADPA